MEKLTREQKRALMDRYFASGREEREQVANATFHFMMGYLVEEEGRASNTFFLHMKANLQEQP